MFPLGNVLFPGAPLALQVFEPRYHRLLEDCLAGERAFGVTLIARGSEVGGGDQRVDVGTVAVIDRTVPLAEGRTGVVAIGTERIQVDRWLPDDPYPRAQVTPWPAAAEATRTPAEAPTPDDVYRAATAAVRQVLAHAAEHGFDVAPATFTSPEDVTVGSWLLAAALPVGPFDQQRILETPDTVARLSLIATLADERLEVLGQTFGG